MYGIVDGFNPHTAFYLFILTELFSNMSTCYCAMSELFFITAIIYTNTSMYMWTRYREWSRVLGLNPTWIHLCCFFCALKIRLCTYLCLSPYADVWVSHLTIACVCILHMKVNPVVKYPYVELNAKEKKLTHRHIFTLQQHNSGRIKETKWTECAVERCTTVYEKLCGSTNFHCLSTFVAIIIIIIWLSMLMLLWKIHANISAVCHHPFTFSSLTHSLTLSFCLSYTRSMRQSPK